MRKEAVYLEGKTTIRDTVMVSYDYDPERGNRLLLVGRKNPDPKVQFDVVNAITGLEAETIFRRLVSQENHTL